MTKRKYEPTPMGEKPHYVYTLSYPAGFIADDGTDLSDVVFYVGKGTILQNGTQRVDAHEGEARSTVQDRYLFNKRKIAAIQAVWRRGLNIQKNVIAEFDSNNEATEYESLWIREYAGPYLTNRADNPFYLSDGQEEIKEPKPLRVATDPREERKKQYLRLRYFIEELRYQPPQDEMLVFSRLVAEFEEEVNRERNSCHIHLAMKSDVCTNMAVHKVLVTDDDGSDYVGVCVEHLKVWIADLMRMGVNVRPHGLSK
jgi:hypothetical protein